MSQCHMRIFVEQDPERDALCEREEACKTLGSKSRNQNKQLNSSDTIARATLRSQQPLLSRYSTCRQAKTETLFKF